MPSPRRRAKGRTDAIAMTPEEELRARLAGDIPPELAAIDDASGHIHQWMVTMALRDAIRSNDQFFNPEGKAYMSAEAVRRIEIARRFRRHAG